MEGDVVASVLRTPSAWLPWLHGAALVIAAWIWLLSQVFDSLWPALDGL
ncbi:MAG: hypothetical protein J0L92_16180 [Deltaproteobacteria bacterium]|nr:hypothetical protein [Deltaproteobacteria bacterium]